MLPSNRKRILILVDWFEPGYKAGGPIQSCKNFVRAFRDEYDLYIITSDRDLGDTTPYEAIRTDCWLKYDGSVNVYYASAYSFNFFNIRKLILETQPDYILLNNMYSLKFTVIPVLLKLLKQIKSTVILSPRGMLHDGAMNFRRYKKELFLSISKFVNIHRRIVFHATDEQEKEDILKYFPKASQVFVAGNFGPSKDLIWVSVPKAYGELKLIFLSRISPKKNLLYLLNLFAEFPVDGKIFLDIAGGIEDISYWEECKAIIMKLPSNIHVKYLGAIKNDEIYERYAHYHIFVLPTLGENFGHAIFEALLLGKPVLISDKTPWRNLFKKKAGYDISLNKPVAFMAAIQSFSNWDQSEYDLWSKSAWSYAERYNTESGTKSKYKEIFN